MTEETNNSPDRSSNSTAAEIYAQQEKFLKQQASIKTGASNISFIGFASVVNILLAVFQVGVFFPVGLYYPILIAEQFPSLALELLIGGTAVFALLFFFLGRKAKLGNEWAFNIALLLYAGDSIIAGILKDWIGLGLHGLIAFYLIGARGNIELAKKTEALLEKLRRSET